MTASIRQPTSPQEELAHRAAEFGRGLRAQFGDTLSAEDVEDIVQTALMTKAPTVADGRAARQRNAWFARVLRNAAIDYLRARDGRGRQGRGPRQLSLDLIGEIYDGDAEAAVAALRVEDDGFDDDRLDREFDANAMRTLARRALDRLRGPDRRLIAMRYRDGLSNAELAEEFGLSLKGLEKRWARAWVAFVNEAAADAVAGQACAGLRRSIAGQELGLACADATARWEAHLHECPACRVWAFVGARSAGVIPALPLGGGVLGKLGLGGLVDRLHATAEQIAAAVGVGGGGAGALGAITAKTAATCATAVVCAGGAAYVAVPVVDQAVRAERPPDGASQATQRAATNAAPQTQTVSATLRAPEPAAPARPMGRMVVPPASSRSGPAAGRSQQSGRVRRERAQARQARATGSPFTPEAGDPPRAMASSGAASMDTVARHGLAASPTPGDASSFSGEFSP